MTDATTSRAPRRACALAIAIVLATVAAAASARDARAQGVRGNVTIVLPSSVLHADTLLSVTPTFFVQASGFSTLRPLRVTLQVDTTARFNSGLTREFERTIDVLDSTATIAPLRALPEGAHVFFRATVTDPAGLTATSAMIGPFVDPPWVTPVSPPVIVGQPVRTRTPRFVWRSPAIGEPPGPWAYSISITNLARQQTTTTNVGADTTFVPSTDLEANAFYTWSITAVVTGTQQRTVVPSPVTFVVEDADVPTLTTSLSPPFPNPFPSAFVPVSCIWFDLRQPSTVSLDVYDLRGVHVRRLVPNAEITGTLPAGAYGRGRTEPSEGCDGRFSWDGTDDHGRTVPEGVYIIRFKGDGREFTRKVLFRGR
ncbi:MAG: hypothetical protein JO180_03350 [Gemmatirosa sp.]|nr:hypothetical protein [Gemmatirosa sp.]